MTPDRRGRLSGSVAQPTDSRSDLKEATFRYVSKWCVLRKLRNWYLEKRACERSCECAEIGRSTPTARAPCSRRHRRCHRQPAKIQLAGADMIARGGMLLLVMARKKWEGRAQMSGRHLQYEGRERPSVLIPPSMPVNDCLHAITHSEQIHQINRRSSASTKGNIHIEHDWPGALSTSLAPLPHGRSAMPEPCQ
jgi:hypothetical protein